MCVCSVFCSRESEEIIPSVFLSLCVCLICFSCVFFDYACYENVRLFGNKLQDLIHIYSRVFLIRSMSNKSHIRALYTKSPTYSDKNKISHSVLESFFLFPHSLKNVLFSCVFLSSFLFLLCHLSILGKTNEAHCVSTRNRSSSFFLIIID